MKFKFNKKFLLSPLFYSAAALVFFTLFLSSPHSVFAEVVGASWDLVAGDINGSGNCVGDCRRVSTTYLSVGHVSKIYKKVDTNYVQIYGGEILAPGDVLRLKVFGYGGYTAVGAGIGTPPTPIYDTLPGYDYNTWRLFLWGDNSSVHAQLNGDTRAWLTTVIQRPNNIDVIESGFNNCTTLTSPNVTSAGLAGFADISASQPVWFAEYECVVANPGNVSLNITSSNVLARQWAAIIAKAWYDHGCNETRNPAYDGSINIVGHRVGDAGSDDHFPGSWPDNILCRWNDNNRMFNLGATVNGTPTWTLASPDMLWSFESKYPPPTVNLYAEGLTALDEVTIAYNTSAILEWTSTYVVANSCNASGDWSGNNKGITGSESTGNLTSNKTYTLTCTGLDGTPKSDSFLVKVSSPPPTCGDGTKDTGETCDNGVNNGSCPATCSTLCTANTCVPPPPTCGDGTKDTGETCDNGVNNGSCPKTCSTSCTANICGSATLNLTANGTGGSITIAYDTFATLKWTSTNVAANSCNASGAWGGAKGSQNTIGVSTGNLISDKTYTLACTGIDGNPISDSVVVKVSSQPVFDYSLSKSGDISVFQGNSGSVVITKTRVAGTSEAVSLSVNTPLPAGVTVTSITNNTCKPTCTGTITLKTSNTTPVASYPITVTGSPLGKTVSFNLIVNEPPPPDTGQILIQRVNQALNNLPNGWSSAWADALPGSVINPSGYTLPTGIGTDSHTVYVAQVSNYKLTMGYCVYNRGEPECQVAGFGVYPCDVNRCEITFTLFKDKVSKIVAKYVEKDVTRFRVEATLDGNPWPTFGLDQFIGDLLYPDYSDPPNSLFSTYTNPDIFVPVPTFQGFSRGTYGVKYKSLGPSGAKFIKYIISSNRPDRLPNPLTVDIPGPATYFVEDEESVIITLIFESIPHNLAVDIAPVSGYSPLNADITAEVSGSATGEIDYYFWWNCNNPSKDLAVVKADPACGNPEEFLDINDNSKTVPHLFECISQYPCGTISKVIAVREGFTAEDRAQNWIQPLLTRVQLNISGDWPKVSPFDATLRAYLSLNSGASPKTPYKYYFWWNCDNPSTDVDVVKLDPDCGNPSFEDMSSSVNPMITDHTFECTGTSNDCYFGVKVIGQATGALPGQNIYTLRVEPQKISINFNVSRRNGDSPLDTEFKVSVFGSAKGTINYIFWWNCNNSSPDIAVVKADPSCDDPDLPENGQKINATTTSNITIKHQYVCDIGTCNFVPKVIVERGTALAETDLESVQVKAIIVPCTNECSPQDAKSCADSNTVQTCGDYDTTDVCLEWGNPTDCPPGDICSAGLCILDTGPGCVIPGDGIITPPEECDPGPLENLGEETCQSKGFNKGGVLRCNPTNCTFNTLECRKGFQECPPQGCPK